MILALSFVVGLLVSWIIY